MHRTSCVGLAEYVKSSTDYWMRFVHEQENNKIEKGSLIHLATNFQKQVHVMDIHSLDRLQKICFRKTKQKTNTAPMIPKKTRTNVSKSRILKVLSDKKNKKKTNKQQRQQQQLPIFRHVP